MIYLLLDDLLGHEELNKLKQRFGDKGVQDLNTTTLDGQRMAIDDLKRACDAAPFLAERRLVVVRRLLAKFEPKTSSATTPRKSGKSEIAKALSDYLAQLPPTTDLVFIEDNLPSADNAGFKIIKSTGAKVVESKRFKDDELVDWVERRVRQKGGRISRRAANELAIYLGNNLWLLDKEIDKLTIYADSAEIGENDVRAMVSYAREANIFNLLDAIGQRDSRTALRRLRELLADGEAPVYLLSMITRQIRLMLLAKELVARGKSADEVGGELRLHRFPRDKILQQIRRFSLAQLERAYEQLLAADSGIKTGKITPLTALDLLVVELAGLR